MAEVDSETLAIQREQLVLQTAQFEYAKSRADIDRDDRLTKEKLDRDDRIQKENSDRDDRIKKEQQDRNALRVNIMSATIPLIVALLANATTFITLIMTQNSALKAQNKATADAASTQATAAKYAADSQERAATLTADASEYKELLDAKKLYFSRRDSVLLSAVQTTTALDVFIGTHGDYENYKFYQDREFDKLKSNYDSVKGQLGAVATKDNYDAHELFDDGLAWIGNGAKHDKVPPSITKFFRTRKNYGAVPNDLGGVIHPLQVNFAESVRNTLQSEANGNEYPNLDDLKKPKPSPTP